MSERLLHHHNLTKPLRLALVLMTILLTLPQTVWGQDFHWPDALEARYYDVSRFTKTVENGETTVTGHCMEGVEYSFKLQTSSGYDASATYSSSNEAVAILNPDTHTNGVEELRIVGAGTTVITATLTGDYDPKTYSYTLVVTEIDTYYQISVIGTEVTSGNCDNVLKGQQNFPDGMVTYDATSNTLILNNADIPDYQEVGAISFACDNLNVRLNGENHIYNGFEYWGQSANGTVTFLADGGENNCLVFDGLYNVNEISGRFEKVTITNTFGETSDWKMATKAFNSQYPDSKEVYIYKDNSSPTILSGGSGTASDPYLIKTKEDLAAFAQYVNNGTITTEYVKLNPEGGELDCDGLTGFEPIGIYGNPFIGKFDGNNCTIKNLTYSTGETTYRVGLFGYVGNEDVSDAKIEKLTLSSCSFNGGEYVGGIVGELKNGTIDNCVLSSCTVKSGNFQIPFAGGIAGKVDNGTINSCTFNSGSVDCTTAYSGEPSGGVYAGGIVGAIETENSVTVSSCTVSSTNVKSVQSGSDGAYDIFVGGIVGRSLGTVAISGNKVTTTDNTKKISCQSSVDYTNYHCGAIIGEKGDETSLTNNTYEYDVTTDIAGTSKSGYTQRGIGGTFYNETTQQYEPYPDITVNNGAMLYTKIVSLPMANTAGSVDGVEGTYYKIDGTSLYVVPGQTAKINATPNTANLYALVWLQAVNVSTTDVIACDSTSIDGGGRQYTFVMPEAQVNINVLFARDISLDTFKPVDAETVYNGTAQALSEITFIYNDGEVQNSFDLESSDYTITKYKNGDTDLGTTAPTNAGIYTVTIEGKGSYTGTKDINYNIQPMDLEAAVIGAIEDQIYTGEAITPEPQVSIVLIEGNEATVLVKDQDFTYSYEANTNMSSEINVPKVIVTGKGNYTGSTEKTFNIVESYNVWVAGTLITSANAANVLGSTPASVTFDPVTSTLSLNKANIVTSNSAGIKSGLANLKVVLSGGKSEVKCSSSDYYAFEGTSENATVSFSSSATSEGNLYITTAGYKKFFKDITPAYDGIAHFDQTSTNYDEYFYLIRKSPWTGSGTEDDPYLVSTTTELKTISTYVNQGIVLNYYFKLNDNIDWSQESSAFTSIGVRKGTYTIFSFDGTFDGNNKTISNLTSENGLFNYVMNGGSIKNLTLTGCTVTGGSTGEDAAGLVADFRSSGKIENCSVINSSITNNNYTNITSAGGIVGYITNGTIDNCSIEDVTITMSGSPTYKQCAGGIVGHTYEGSTITNCEVKVNTGTTKITNTAETDQDLYAGAIVGWRERGKTLTGNTYQAGVVVETRQGNNPAVTKSGNTQRGLGDGDDTDGAVLEGVKKITVTKNDNGTVEYVSGIYRVDGNDIYALPYSLSNEPTVIKGTSAASYDEPTIDIKTATNSTAIIPEAVEDTSDEGLLYAQWSFPMPDDDATATITFAINLAKEARNFVIANRDYTSEPLPVTEIKTTLDALDASNPAFIELQSGTHFNVTGYKDSQDVAIGTTAPTNAGNYKVVIEGIGDCTGTATISFVINRLAITPELTVSDWIYGSDDLSGNAPSLTDGSNPGDGAVTFYFKKEGENEFHTMEVSSTTDADNYSVYATIAQSTNYEGAQTETKTFTIDQAEITNVILENAQLTFIPGDDYAGVAQTVTISKLETETVDVTGNDITQFFSIEGATQTAAGNYTVTVSAKTDIANNFKGSGTANWSITHRTKDPLAFSSGITYQTFYDANESWLLPAGQSAYLVTGVGETSVTITQVSFIKKGVPVLVKNAAGDELDETPDATFATNKLKYVSDVNGFDTNGGQYVLYKDEFVKATGNIPAGKCYLETAVGSGARGLGIENDGTTNIHVVSGEEAIENSDIWYDLQGRHIEKPTKSGLYIHNNRKIVIK